MAESKPWQDENRLRKLYHEKGLSQSEIAERLGTTQPNICIWMSEFGVESRNLSLANSMASGPLSVRTTRYGYEVVETREDYEKKYASIHRLTAVAYHGFERVAESVVHHVNHIPWDNRPGNLELMSDGEHKRLHAKERRREGGRFA